jgi:hypothetical protein
MIESGFNETLPGGCAIIVRCHSSNCSPPPNWPECATGPRRGNILPSVTSFAASRSAGATGACNDGMPSGCGACVKPDRRAVPAGRREPGTGPRAARRSGRQSARISDRQLALRSGRRSARRSGRLSARRSGRRSARRSGRQLALRSGRRPRPAVIPRNQVGHRDSRPRRHQDPSPSRRHQHPWRPCDPQTPCSYADTTIPGNHASTGALGALRHQTWVLEPTEHRRDHPGGSVRGAPPDPSQRPPHTAPARREAPRPSPPGSARSRRRVTTCQRSRVPQLHG